MPEPEYVATFALVFISREPVPAAVDFKVNVPLFIRLPEAAASRIVSDAFGLIVTAPPFVNLYNCIFVVELKTNVPLFVSVPVVPFSVFMLNLFALIVNVAPELIVMFLQLANAVIIG